MALLGTGAICIWNDITPEGRDDFYAWHITEHIPERVAIPGFRRGRRLIAIEPRTTPEFFTLYETVDTAVHVSPAYLERLNAPTPWTVRAQKGFGNMVRALTEVVVDLGTGAGGVTATVELGTRGLVARDHLERVARLPHITSVSLCRTDPEASALRTTESRNRGDSILPPVEVVLIEGCVGAAVRAAVDALLAPDGGVAVASTKVGLYRLEHLGSAR